jgi:hypothetical protein
MAEYRVSLAHKGTSLLNPKSSSKQGNIPDTVIIFPWFEHSVFVCTFAPENVVVSFTFTSAATDATRIVRRDPYGLQTFYVFPAPPQSECPFTFGIPSPDTLTASRTAPLSCLLRSLLASTASYFETGPNVKSSPKFVRPKFITESKS